MAMPVFDRNRNALDVGRPVRFRIRSPGERRRDGRGVVRQIRDQHPRVLVQGAPEGDSTRWCYGSELALD